MHQIAQLMSLFMGEIKEPSQLRLVGLTPPEQWFSLRQSKKCWSVITIKINARLCFFNIIKIDWWPLFSLHDCEHRAVRPYHSFTATCFFFGGPCWAPCSCLLTLQCNGVHELSNGYSWTEVSSKTWSCLCRWWLTLWGQHGVSLTNPHRFTVDPSGIRFGLTLGDTLRFLDINWSFVGYLSACSWPMRSCLLSSGGAPDSGNWRPSCSQRTPSKSCLHMCGGGCRYAHTCTHKGHYCWMKH